ncbi:MAG: dienelactone hydrolase family protein [Phenylobacterium sp.]
MGETIRIQVNGGEMTAYLARPAAAKAPAIVVLQEIFGVNAVMRDITDGLAAQGFLAVCPDLFWRIEPGVDITDQSEAEWKKAFALMNAFDAGQGVKDIAATIGRIRTDPACSGRVGAVGFCLGGQLAWLTATRTDIDAAVAYYGVGIEGLVGEAADLRHPGMLHIAEADGFVPPPAQAAIRAGLAGQPLVTIHTYPGRDHAFARIGGEHYHAADATLAGERSLAFLRTHLGSA